MSDLNEVNSHLASSSSKIMITEEETANGLLSCILQIRFYSAGCHLQRTGDTMAPSFLSWAKALSTSLRSSPERVATSPADTGLPALRIVSSTFAVVSILTRVQRLIVCGKPCRVSQARGLPCVHGRQRPYCLLRPWRGHRSCAAGDRRVYEQGRGRIISHDFNYGSGG